MIMFCPWEVVSLRRIIPLLVDTLEILLVLGEFTREETSGNISKIFKTVTVVLDIKIMHPVYYELIVGCIKHSQLTHGTSEVRILALFSPTSMLISLTFNLNCVFVKKEKVNENN